MELFYRPGEAVLGDVIPFYDAGEFKPFYLKNTRGHAGPDCEEGWHRLSTKDHLHFTEFPAHIRGGTGSVLKVGELYHMFYCTFEDNPRRQFIRHATSRDLERWETADGVLPADGKIYDPAEWRDPFVFWNEGEQKWWMLIATAVLGKTERRACVGLCVSDDLRRWAYREPFYAPMAAAGACECPDLFRMGEWYYLVFSNYCDRFQTLYRMSRSLRGPWLAPERDTLDSRAYYAAKTGTDGSRRYIYGWNPTKELPKKTFNPGNRISRDCCSWDWGGNLVVHELLQNPDGTLRVVPEAHVDAALQTRRPVDVTPVLGGCEASPHAVRLRADCGFGGVLLDRIPALCKLEGEVRFKPGTRRFGIALQVDEQYDTGYYLYLEPGRNRLEYVSEIRFWGPDGEGGKMFPYAVELERPFTLEADRFYPFKIFVQDSVLVVYFGGEIAMNARMYDYSGRRFGLFAIDGEAEFRNLSLCTE